MNNNEEINGLVLTSERELTPQVWQMFSQMAPVMHNSRLFGVTSQDQAAAIMLKGYELGLSITASFEFINVIQGKPSLSPRGCLALLHNSPLIEKIEIKRLEKNGQFYGYSCYMKRSDNGFEHTSQFTMDDARKAGLIKPGGNWEMYPENMCQWRAIGFNADIVAPDITGGLTNIMKMGEVYVDEANVFDVTEVKQPAQTNTEQPETIDAEFTLDELVNVFGAEQIMVANEGKIPATSEEVQAVAKKLAGAE